MNKLRKMFFLILITGLTMAIVFPSAAAKVPVKDILKNNKPKIEVKKQVIPSLISVFSTGNTSVKIKYSRKVNISKAKFQINEKYGKKIELKVDMVELDKTNVVINLTTAPQKAATLYLLTISGIKYEGSVLREASVTFIGQGPIALPDSGISSFTAIIDKNNSNKLILDFNTGLDKNTATDIKNYMIDGGIGNPTAAVFENEKDKSVIALILPKLEPAKTYTIKVNNLKNTQGIIMSGELSNVFTTDSIADTTTDKIPPKLLTAVAVTNTSIKLVFDKEIKVEAASFLIGTSNGIKDILKVTKVEVGPDNKSVILSTANQVPGTVYKVYATGVSNSDGIVAEELTAIFAGMGDIIPPTKEALIKLVSVKSLSSISVEIVFDSPIDLSGITFTINEKYGLKQGLAVSSITPAGDGRTFKLITGIQKAAILYELCAKGLTGIDGTIGSGVSSMVFVGMGAPIDPSPTIVEPDAKVTSLCSGSNTTVEIIFDKPIIMEEIKFSIQGLGIEAATFSDDRKKVTLHTANQVAGTIYKITISGLKSAEGLPATPLEKMFVGSAPPPPPIEMRKPNLDYVLALGNTSVKAGFDMEIDISNAVFNVVEVGGSEVAVAIIGVALDADNKAVILSTESLKQGAIYRLNVNGIRSKSGLEGNAAQLQFAGI